MPPQPRRSKAWALLPFLIGALLAYVGYQQFRKSTTNRPAAVTLRTAKVTKGDLNQTFRVSGTISAKTFAAISAPQVRGRGNGDFGSRQMVLMKIATPGSYVKKGDIIAEFDRQDQEERLYRLHSEVVDAQAAVDKRRSELTILLETLRQEMRVAEGEYGKAVQDVRTAEVRSDIEAEILRLMEKQYEAESKQKREEVAMLEKSHKAEIRGLEIVVEQEKLDEKRGRMNADQMAMRSPINGTVVMMTTFRGPGQFSQITQGDEVRPGTYFMQIVDPSTMVLEGSFNQSDMQRLRVGQQAVVRLDAYPNKSWEGQVVAMGASTGASGSSMRGPLSGTGDYVRNIPVVVAINGADREIIPDLSGSADVSLGTEQNVLLVPKEAVRHEGGEAVVYVSENNQPRRQIVQLGSENDSQVVVLSGVNEGDALVIAPPSPPQLASAQ